MPSGKNHYEAKIVYDDDSIRRMFRTEYYVYETAHRLIRLGFGVAALLIALFADIPTPPRVLCLMMGVWLVIAGDFPSKIQAEGVISKRGGKSSTVRCLFDDNTLFVENGLRIPYKQLDKIVEDSDYFYLFRDRQTAVMVPIQGLVPQDIEGFKELVARKSGKAWGPVSVNFLEFNLKDLVALADRRKKQKNK